MKAVAAAMKVHIVTYRYISLDIAAAMKGVGADGGGGGHLDPRYVVTYRDTALLIGLVKRGWGLVGLGGLGSADLAAT